CVAGPIVPEPADLLCAGGRDRGEKSEAAQRHQAHKITLYSFTTTASESRAAKVRAVTARPSLSSTDPPVNEYILPSLYIPREGGRGAPYRNSTTGAGPIDIGPWVNTRWCCQYRRA